MGRPGSEPGFDSRNLRTPFQGECLCFLPCGGQEFPGLGPDFLWGGRWGSRAAACGSRAPGQRAEGWRQAPGAQGAVCVPRRGALGAQKLESLAEVGGRLSRGA